MGKYSWKYKYVEEDWKYIETTLKIESYKKLSTDNKLVINIFPQHFIGDIKQLKILILSLNPGINNDYLTLYKNNKNLKSVIIENLNLNDPKFYTFDFDEVDKVN